MVLGDAGTNGGMKHVSIFRLHTINFVVQTSGKGMKHISIFRLHTINPSAPL